MLKQFLNNSAHTALMLFDGSDQGIDPKIALREQIAKGNLPPSETEIVPEVDPEEEIDPDAEIDPEEEIKDFPEETAKVKAEREAAEKIAAKAKRKDDRMQRRIDEAIAAKKIAEDALKAFKEANPDVKLTEAEVETKADLIANQKLAAKNAKDIQEKFDDACDKLQKGARKVEGELGKNFDDNVNDMADQFGPIPSFMIGVLEDFENGAEVLAYIAGTDEVAEKIYNLKSSPAKMTNALVEIKNKLIEAKKKPKKQISKVEIPVEPVSGSRHVSTVITESDTKDMPSYVAKRRAQQEAARKARGW